MSEVPVEDEREDSFEVFNAVLEILDQEIVVKTNEIAAKINEKTGRAVRKDNAKRTLTRMYSRNLIDFVSVGWIKSKTVDIHFF